MPQLVECADNCCGTETEWPSCSIPERIRGVVHRVSWSYSSQNEGGLPARNGLAAPARWPGVRLAYFVVVVVALLSSAGWVAGGSQAGFP